MEQSVVIYNHGQKIFGNYYLPVEGAPCVLMSHGFEGSKDGEKWLVLSRRLCDAGLASLRFNYRGCGEGEEQSEGEFEDTTLSGRVSDYRAAIDFLQQANIDTARLGVIGSSFGGMIPLAAADERIAALVTLATPFSLRFPRQPEIEQSHDSGYYELESGNRLKIGFFQDLKKYDIGDSINNIHCPILIIHGTSDDVVSTEDAHRLYYHASEPRRLEEVEGANHVFSEPEHLEKIVNLSLEWFKRYL